MSERPASPEDGDFVPAERNHDIDEPGFAQPVALGGKWGQDVRRPVGPSRVGRGDFVTGDSVTPPLGMCVHAIDHPRVKCLPHPCALRRHMLDMTERAAGRQQAQHFAIQLALPVIG